MFGPSGKVRVSPRSSFSYYLPRCLGFLYLIPRLVFSVQDGGLTVFWGLQKAINREPVSFGEGTGDEKQNWLLIPA